MKQTQFAVTFLDKEYPALYITELPQAIQVMDKLQKYDCWFGFDTETMALPEWKHIETAALSPHTGKVRLIQICNGKSSVMLDMLFLERGAAVLWDTFMEKLLLFLETKTLIGHYAMFDLKYMLHWFHPKKIDIRCSWILSKILLHATFPTDANTKAKLEDMVLGIFGVKISKAVQASDWSKPDLTFEQIQYAAVDPIACLKVYEKLYESVDKYRIKAYLELCEAAQVPIARMELHGIGFNVSSHRELVMGSWRRDLFKARTKIETLTGLDSVTGPGLIKWFEKHLPKDVLDNWPRTEKGNMSVDANALLDFSYLEVVKPFAEYQKLKTLCSGFGMKLLQQINAATGRLHSTYWICGARTGRLSSSNPNLQNAPRDKVMRSHFIAAPGKVFLVADYSQVEVRTAAEHSRDPEMLRCYREGIDIHARTVSALMGKPIEDVTDDERQFGKSLVFGCLYGIGPNSFIKYAQKGYGVQKTHAEAKNAIDQFKELYSGYFTWAMKQVEEAAQRLWIRTATGKHRKLDRDNCYGAALNTPIQGAAAECILRAAIRLDSLLTEREHLCNIVHDELILEVDDTPRAIKEGSDKLETSMRLGFLDIFPRGIVKGICDVGVGHNWAEAKKKKPKEPIKVAA